MTAIRIQMVCGKTRNIHKCGCGSEIFYTVENLYDGEKLFRKFTLDGEEHLCEVIQKYDRVCPICDLEIKIYRDAYGNWHKENPDGTDHSMIHPDGILRVCFKCANKGNTVEIILSKRDGKWVAFNKDGEEHVHPDMRKKENKEKYDWCPDCQVYELKANSCISKPTTAQLIDQAMQSGMA